MPSSPQPENREVLERVNRVARQALMEIVERDEDSVMIRKPLESYLDLMFDAVLDRDPNALAQVIADMRTALIPVPVIAESYIPTVARRLGDAWCVDRVDFAKVTIGSARLQATLRQFEGDWNDRPMGRSFQGPGVLVGVPDGVQHTMGACVLAGQLRNKGFSVQLNLAITPDELACELGSFSFAAVMLSASGAEHLDSLCALVTCAKKTSRNTPVILGGSILSDFQDICSLTQADLATNGLHDALRFCGMHAANRQLSETLAASSELSLAGGTAL